MDLYVVDFFKKMGFYNSEYFKQISENTLVVDKDYEEIIDFIGFYPDTFKLILPKIKTYRDVLIWVHEYSHALFPDDEDEIFPNLMEDQFINMYIDDKEIIKELLDDNKRQITKSIDLNHTVAKKIKLDTINMNKML